MTVLSSSVSTYSLLAEPDTTHNGLSYLSLGSGAAQAYIYHPLTGIPAGATVTSAILRVYAQGTWAAGAVTVTAQAVSAFWTPLSLTWTNQPTVSGATSTATLVGPVGDASLFSLDVTAQVVAAVSSGSWFGLRLVKSTATVNPLYSDQSAAYRPTLDVTYTTTPTKPTGLAPSGGRAVATNKPTVSWTGGVVSAVQVQIDATAGTFATPEFDSGTVVTSYPALDLSTTAYAGIAAGVDKSWRARHQNLGGVWSPWSDVAHMTFRAYATVTLTNPAAAPNNLVLTDTPTFTWTVSGTQTRWRVSLARTASPLVVLHQKSGTGATTSYGLPAGIITDSSPYTLTLAVADTYDREAVPGYPVEATVTL